MMARCRQLLFVAVILAVVAGSLTFVAGSAAAQDEPEADGVLLEIDIQPDGDAVWRVEYRYTLDEDTESEGFYALQDRIDSNPDNYTSRFRDRMEESVWAAENSTDREMAIENVTVSTRTQAVGQTSGTTGMVTYEFTWTNFANATDSGIRIGNAIHGFYVSPDSTLILTWPDGYAIGSVQPSADQRDTQRLAWEGETNFASDEPAVVLADETATDATGETADGSTEGESSNGQLMTVALLGMVALGIAGAGGMMILRRQTAEPADQEGTDTATESVPAELLSNEEQVIAALEEHDGRMKQQELSEHCDWHESKTSKVVTELKEEGVIDVFRIGRENVLSLPEVDDNDW